MQSMVIKYITGAGLQGSNLHCTISFGDFNYSGSLYLGIKGYNLSQRVVIIKELIYNIHPMVSTV